MKSAEERKKHFKEDLGILLSRHGAEIELDCRGYEGMGYPTATVTMSSIYADDDSGDLLADFCEFTLFDYP